MYHAIARGAAFRSAFEDSIEDPEDSTTGTPRHKGTTAQGDNGTTSLSPPSQLDSTMGS